VSALTPVMLTPTSCAPWVFAEAARIARPVHVRLKKSQSRMRTSAATAHANTWAFGSTTSPISNDWSK
jgi:hypothetical protein